MPEFGVSDSRASCFMCTSATFAERFPRNRAIPKSSWMTVISNIKISQSDGRRITPPMFAHVFRLQVPQGRIAAFRKGDESGAEVQQRTLGRRKTNPAAVVVTAMMF